MQIYISVLCLHWVCSTPPLPAFAADPASLRKETIYHLPQGSTNFLPLAKVSYNVSRPESSKIESFTPAKASKSQSAEDATTVGVILSSPLPKSLSAEDPNLRYRTTLTSSKTLHAPYKGRFAITVDEIGGSEKRSMVSNTERHHI